MAVARHGAGVQLADEAVRAIAGSRAVVEALADDVEPHYGVSTGFGALATRHIPPTACAVAAQPDSLARGRAGPGVEREVVRAMMLLRLATLATGRTGVRRDARRCSRRCCRRLTPVVHEYGCLGCSGDLAPLAHVALAVIGEGTVRMRPGSWCRRGGDARGRGRAGRPAGEGRAGPDQRHGRHARQAGAGVHRPRAAVPDRRRHSGDERGGFAGHRPGVRRGPAGAAAASRTGGRCGEHARLLADSPIVASHAGPDCT